MYKCQHFKIHELVPKHVYHQRGEKAWELMDESILITIDRLRDKYGSMTINNYYWGGDRNWSGLRTPDSPYYSAYSQHTFGRAVDIIFNSDITASEVREDLIRNYNNDSVFEFINSVELDTSWLHIDCRNSHRLKTYTP